MRIGIDCRMYSTSFTGIGRYTFELVKNLAKIDQKNDYFLFLNSPEFEKFQSPAPNFIPIKSNTPHYSFKEQTHFLKLLNSYNLDLVHFTHFNAPIFYKKPSIVTIHDLTLHFFPGRKMTSVFRRLAYESTIRSVTKNAQKVIAVSENTAADLQNLLNTPTNKIDIIYEGVSDEFQIITDTAKIQNIKNKFKITKSFLLYTGVWRNHKNLKGLLDAFAILAPKYDIQLVITGKTNNMYAPEIFKQIESLCLPELDSGSSSVIFTDFVSENDLVELINAAQIYVFPSFYEGFGLPPLEAMKCGTPVAVSSTSCLPEICQKNAVYFNPYDPTDIAQEIEKLLTNKELYEKLRLSGIEYVKKFSWPKMAETTHNIYLDVLGQNS